MKLDARQVRFLPSFLPTWRTRTLRLGGRGGSLHVQEPALVLEGELLRFRLIFGIEWLFRRALSEWTTVTVPYARIIRVRRTRAWLVRILLILALIVTWGGMVLLIWLNPSMGMLLGLPVALMTVLFGYILLRVRSTVTVVYRPKSGRRTQVLVWVRRRALRQAFLAALSAHRAAADRFRTAAPASG